MRRAKRHVAEEERQSRFPLPEFLLVLLATVIGAGCSGGGGADTTSTTGTTQVAPSPASPAGPSSAPDVPSTAPAPVGTQLAAPTGMVALNATSETITLVWDVSQGASGYHIYRNGTLVGASTSAMATTYVDSGLTPNSAYSYTVTSYNADVESPQSVGIARNTTISEPTRGRIGYRFPTNQQRWDEFLESPDGSYTFAIYDADPVDGSDRYDPTHVSPYIRANLASAHAQNRGLKVLGHVAGVGTSTDVGAIKAKIDTWYTTFPDLDGIYVGDAGYSGPTGDPTARRLFLQYWAEIAAYIHAKGGFAVFHGGVPNDMPSASAAVQADLEENIKQLLRYYETIAVYETFWADEPEPALYGWMVNNVPGDPYDYAFRFRYEIFANGVAGSQLGPITSYFMTKNVGYLYITDVDLSHDMSDGSLDPRDDQSYWICESAFIQLPPNQCNSPL
jgi:hypothetical protein